MEKVSIARGTESVILIKQISNFQNFTMKQAEEILKYFLMPFTEVPQEFIKKQMKFMEVKSSEMKENRLRMYFCGIKSISITFQPQSRHLR